MTQPALDFFKKRAILLKQETTEGTDASPTGGSDAFMFFNGSSSTQFDKVERALDRSFFGNDPFGVANRRVSIEGEFELWAPTSPGGASNSDAYAKLVLLPAGMAATKDAVAKTTRYNPVSSAIPSYTGYWHHTGTLVKALGARANITGLAMEIGKRFMGKATVMGNYTDVSEASAPSVTLPTKVPVIATAKNTVCKLSTLVKGGTSSTAGTPLTDLHLWAKMLSVDFGNELGHKEYTEKSVNAISERKGTFSLRIAKTDITNDFNPWYVRDNGTIITADFSLYEADTKDTLYSTLGIRGQIENITPTDIDGDYGWEITGPCVPSASGGDDFYVLFGDAS